MNSKLYAKSLKLIAQKKYLDANAILKKIISTDSKNINYKLAIEHTKMALCKWDNLDKREFILKKLIKNHSEKDKKIDFPICYYPINLSLKFYKKLNKSYKNFKNFPGDLKKNSVKKTIKLGYLSLDFRSHSAGISLYPIIETHKRFKINTTAYTLKSNKVPKKIFNEVRYINNLSIEKIKNIIKKDNIDILVETTRNLLFSKSGIAKFKNNTVVLSAWGYGEFYEPKVLCSSLLDNYQKKTLKNKKIETSSFLVKNYLPIKPESIFFTKSNIKKQYNLPKNSILVGNFNAIYKLRPTLLNTWIRILKKIDNTFFLIICENNYIKINLIKEIKKRNLDTNRFIFLKKVFFKKHLNRIYNLDLALDNPFFGGGTTLPNCLSIGTPVLTLKGTHLGSYSGENILKNYMLGDFVAPNLSEYEKKAISILKNKKYLKKAKKRFKKLRSSLPSIWESSLGNLNKSLIKIARSNQEL